MQNPFRDKFHHMGFEFLDRDFKNRLHPGVDLNGTGSCNEDLGIPVYPMADGEIIQYYNDGGRTGWGEMLMLFHPEYNVYSVYAHIQKPVSKLPQWIQKTKKLCEVGNAFGKWCAHIHFEVRKKRFRINQYPDKSWDEAKIKEHYYNPLKFIKNNQNKSMPQDLSGGEIQKLVFGLIGHKMPIDDAEKVAKEKKASDYVTELLNHPNHKKHFEKIENAFECLDGNCASELEALKVTINTIKEKKKDLLQAVKKIDAILIDLNALNI